MNEHYAYIFCLVHCYFQHTNFINVKNMLSLRRKANGFKSLQLSYKEITQVIWKLQISISFSKILPCYFVQLDLLKKGFIADVLIIQKFQMSVSLSKAYFRPCVEARRAEIISARLGSAWHASVLDEENIAVLKQFYWWYLIKDNFKVKENINNNLSN